LQKVLRDSRHDTSPGDASSSFLARYSEQCQPCAGRTLQRAALLCRTQMFHDGPAAAAMRGELPSDSEGDMLFRGFASFSGAPVLDGIELSPHYYFHNQAIRK